MQPEVRVVTPDDRVAGAPTSGMSREEAVATEGMWSGVVRTEPGMVSGWHHHGEYESTIYIVRGAMRVEFGPGGERGVEARPGDFLYVPKGVVHREINPADEESVGVVVRAGTGEAVFNVEAP